MNFPETASDTYALLKAHHPQHLHFVQSLPSRLSCITTKRNYVRCTRNRPRVRPDIKEKAIPHKSRGYSATANGRDEVCLCSDSPLSHAAASRYAASEFCGADGYLPSFSAAGNDSRFLRRVDASESGAVLRLRSGRRGPFSAAPLSTSASSESHGNGEMPCAAYAVQDPSVTLRHHFYKLPCAADSLPSDTSPLRWPSVTDKKPAPGRHDNLYS
jgi:hypothetical protein